MTVQMTPYLVPLILSSVIALVLFVYSARQLRKTTGEFDLTLLAFCLMMLANGIWTMGFALQISSVEVAWKAFWINWQQVGVVLVPTLWVVFALGYTGYKELLTRRILGLLALQPAATYLVLLFDPPLYIKDFKRVTVDGLVLVEGILGPLGHFNVIYGNLLVILGMLLFLRMALTSQKLYRGQAWALFLGVGLPLVPSLLHAFDVTVINYTPIMLAFSGVAFAYAIFRYRLLDLEPVARNQVIEGMQDSFLVLDPQGTVVDMNPSAARLVGGESRVGEPIDQVLPRVTELVEKKQDKPLRKEIAFDTEENGRRFFDVNTSPLSQGEFEGTLVLLRDVTDRAEVKRRFQELIENTSDLISVLDEDATFQYLSPSVERILDYDTEELQGEPVLDYIHPDDLDRVQEELTRGIENPGYTAVVEHRFRHADGSWRTLESKGRSLLHNTFVEGIVINSRDITERKQLEEQLRHQAQYDELTGLPNRSLFMDRLEDRLDALGNGAGERFGLIYMDLDRFKTINDSLGHHAGDELLKAVGERLQDAVNGSSMVARLGGDEFAVLLEELDDSDEACEEAGKIADQLERPFNIQDQRIFTTASMGVLVPDGGTYRDTEDVLRDADIAMYRSKKSSECYTLFEPGMHQETEAEMKLEMQLQDAIENGELEVHYQPILRIDEEALLGFEALVRWNHPERGYLTPGEFLPLAKKTGYMLNIDRWVLQQACRDLKRWRDHHPEMDLSMSVNCSQQQFMDPAFVDLVEENLQNRELDPGALYLEITERTVVSNPDRITDIIRRLQEDGVHIVLDDFGTGYSSLSYLSTLPIDILKIDRSFVYKLKHEENGQASERMVRVIMNMAENLDTNVIAEGIENQEQTRSLLSMDCTQGQGFHFAKPMKASEVEAFIENFDTAAQSPHPVEGNR